MSVRYLSCNTGKSRENEESEHIITIEICTDYEYLFVIINSHMSKEEEEEENKKITNSYPGSKSGRRAAVFLLFMFNFLFANLF